MRVLVFGTFDQLHPGHEFVLTEAAKRGQLNVVVARDANVQLLKGKSPAENEDQRMAHIQARFPSATVMLGDPVDFLVPVRRISPDRILLGYDQELPTGVTVDSLEVPVERLPAFHPEKYKTTILQQKKDA